MTRQRTASAGSRSRSLRRTSHALLVGGRVWLIDPIDGDGLEERIRALGEPGGVLQLLDRHRRDGAVWAERLGVELRCAWQGVGDAPFETLPIRDSRRWHEVALFEPASRTLLCADALGTLSFFRAGDERIGLHPLLRLAPPRSLLEVEPNACARRARSGSSHGCRRCRARGGRDGPAAAAARRCERDQCSERREGGQ